VARYERNFCLTEEQKKLASDNFPLVWWYIKKLLLSKKIKRREIDDVSGYIVYRLCMAAETYDPSKGKFSTYAAIAFHFGYKKYLYDYNKHHKKTVCYGEDDKLLNVIYEDSTKIDWDNIKFLFDGINLSSLEMKIIYYRYIEKMNNSEIGRKINYSKERIRQVHNEIIEKVKRYVIKEHFIIEDFVKKD
jgi:RNA polymerase sigma factor (sigma-70 family)